MQPNATCLNFSSLPTNAAAAFTRFEPTFIGFDSCNIATETLTPIRYVKEWVYPRVGPGREGDGAYPEYPEFKTVRISEHKWPLHKTTTTTHSEYVRPDMWPPARREPLTREQLVCDGLLISWQRYPLIDCGPTLPLNHEARIEHYRSQLNPAPNDDLPDDYLEFWQEGKGDDNVAND